MIALRKIRLLWLFVVLVITPVISLPWNTIGKTIAQQQEDDDDAGADDGDPIALCAPGPHYARTPHLPPRSESVEVVPQPVFVAHHDRPLARALPRNVSQSTRVRLQI